LIPYASNSRTHSDAQVAQIAASIKEFGWTNPILIDGENTIIAGHGRLLAARKLGLDKVPAIVLDHLTKPQQRALVIADNQLALNAGWDSEMLKAEIENLKLDDFDIDLLAFSDAELSALFLEKEDGKTDADEEWQGMPEFEDEDPCFRKVIVSFDTPEDVAEFFSIIGQSDTGKTKSIWFPEKERRDLESLRWAEDEE
jgi:ParB-like chromosome segregation protein Spo0J